MISFREVAKKGRSLEKEIGADFNAVLSKFSEECGELVGAIQSFRGIYTRKDTNIEGVKDEMGDVLFNLVSLASRLGIDPDTFSELANNTVKKFDRRVTEDVSYKKRE